VSALKLKPIAGSGTTLLVALSIACGPPSGPSTMPPESSPLAHVAHVHRARCGSCHVRVEPGERTRAQLEEAFTRHRARVHLTEEQWGQMIDYLASQPQRLAQ
jgi:hypothetical protein